MGLLQFHEHPQPRKIVQTKDVVLIIYEANYGLRQIIWLLGHLVTWSFGCLVIWLPGH